MSQGMRSDFFLEGPFMPPRMKLDRDPLGGLADMFGQMPGMQKLHGWYWWSQLYCAENKNNKNCFSSPNNIGSGIGTGPGVIQDRFSPTMGRHRSNQLFNGHGGHLMPSAQSQFGELGKSFLKSQVRKNIEWLEHVSSSSTDAYVMDYSILVLKDFLRLESDKNWCSADARTLNHFLK